MLTLNEPVDDPVTQSGRVSHAGTIRRPHPGPWMCPSIQKEIEIKKKTLFRTADSTRPPPLPPVQTVIHLVVTTALLPVR